MVETTAAAEELLRRFKSSLVEPPSPLSEPEPDEEAPRPAAQIPQPTMTVLRHEANVTGVYGGINAKLAGNAAHLMSILERSVERLTIASPTKPEAFAAKLPHTPAIAEANSVTETPPLLATPDQSADTTTVRAATATASQASPLLPPLPPPRPQPPAGRATAVESELQTPPVEAPAPLPATPSPPQSALVSRFGGLGFATPAPGREPAIPMQQIEHSLVQAARDAARWLAVDDSQWHQAKKFVDDCLVKPNPAVLKRRGLTESDWLDAKLERMRAAVAADPGIATCRPINRSALPMDGWTPLHAAAAVGNLPVVQELLRFPEVKAWCVDLQGRTPLALAAEHGHAEVSRFLKRCMEKEATTEIVGVYAPVDLAGRTPLAWSAKSKSRNRDLERQLYALGDASICPVTPAAARGGGDGDAGTLVYGHSEAPGYRVEMEDAICVHCPLHGEGASSGVFGVFDGHGGAFCSKFASERLLDCLLATEAWASGDRSPEGVGKALEAAFLAVDALLEREPRMAVMEQETSGASSGGGGDDGGGGEVASVKRYRARDSSGSTAVVAVITPTHVIVANAGDSRALMASPAQEGGESSGNVVSVHELTQDHTARLPEERARVEAAGGGVEERRYEENGHECSILRIKYHPDVRGQSVIPSRSLGDFYYKQRRDLGPEAQVVTAVPEVRWHERRTDGHEYLMLACDGVWDVMECDEAAQLLCESALGRPLTGEGLAAACDDLVQDALARASQDNITVMAVHLPPRGKGRVLFE